MVSYNLQIQQMSVTAVKLNTRSVAQKGHNAVKLNTHSVAQKAKMYILFSRVSVHSNKTHFMVQELILIIMKINIVWGNVLLNHKDINN